MKRQLRQALAIALLAGAGHSQAQEKLLVQAVLDPNTSVVDSVKRECALDTMVGDWVLESVSRKYPGSSKLQPGDSASGKVLRVTIVSVHGAGGGAFGGMKGTCQIFGRVAKTLGSDVAGWVPSALKGN